MASNDHPTAAQIFRRARRRFPAIAYATIYNGLRWWVARGALREFSFGPPRRAATRYDRNNSRHDHAICIRCGRVIDTTVRLPTRVLARIRRQTGFRITGHHVQFLGICPGCA